MLVTIDTLQVYERLRKADLHESAAKEIAEIFQEVVEGHLATKLDLEQTESRLKAEIEQTESRLKAEIEKLRIELQWEIEKLRTETKADIEKCKFELKGEIEKSKSEIIKWMVGMLMAQTALLATLAKLFLS
ncbi:MAG TPA: hypothetical protein VJL89_01330 [Thermodesulfovibrionia bacterium]|nr:hypothetical protein [Thermodesulfovibrionia bacterium]